MSTSSSMAMRVALAGSAALVLLGGAAFWYASQRATRLPGKTGDNAVTVTIRGKVCDPSDITVPAGTTTFTIVNATDRALEWEILDGVMVVDERENITPGMRQSMTVKLLPGDYEITCGLLNNPRGRLRVTPSAQSDAEAARPALEAYVGALAEYQVYLLTEVETLDTAAQDLVTALKAGQAARASELYGPAHEAYVRIEAAGQLFGDLEARLNARPDYFEKRAADPGFLGFRRIAHGLRAGGDTKALAATGDRLLADIATLKQRLATIELRPEQLSDLAAKQLRGLAAGLGTTGDDSPADVRAAIAGVGKIAELLSPLLVKADAGLDATLKADLAAASRAVPAKADGLGDGKARAILARALVTLGDDFGRINAALGLQ